jgi:hypothetical protein
MWDSKPIYLVKLSGRAEDSNRRLADSFYWLFGGMVEAPDEVRPFCRRELSEY